MSTEASPTVDVLDRWWARQLRTNKDLGQPTGLHVRVPRETLPVEALRSLVPEGDSIILRDPLSGSEYLHMRWSRGILRADVGVAEVPPYIGGYIRKSSLVARLRILKRKHLQIDVQYLLPLDSVTEQILALVTEKSIPPMRSRRVRPQARTVNVLMHGEEGVHVLPLDLPKRACRLILGNYTPDVQDRYRDLVAFIQGRTPLEEGRLTLIDGPPGTGKTYLIQALLAKQSTCILIPGSVGAILDQPSFTPWLLGYCRDVHGGVTLVLEDADELLRHRDHGGSLSRLSGLLNATSGIMATLTGVRILATVNTDAAGSTLDPAVLRPGRLYRRVHVGPLDMEQARAVVLRESGSEVAAAGVSGPLTLAECYARGRGVP